MADIKQDLLSLQYSDNFVIQGLQEANIDLELPPASASAATVYGVVTDGTAPIADATVKLFDNNGLPYKHTLTDASGAYSITGVPAGTYSLSAVKEGYLLSDAFRQCHGSDESRLHGGSLLVSGGHCRHPDSHGSERCVRAAGRGEDHPAVGDRYRGGHHVHGIRWRIRVL